RARGLRGHPAAHLRSEPPRAAAAERGDDCGRRTGTVADRALGGVGRSPPHRGQAVAVNYTCTTVRVERCALSTPACSALLRYTFEWLRSVGCCSNLMTSNRSASSVLRISKNRFLVFTITSSQPDANPHP